ncbi:PepSY domain-containing protein [Ectothiorhodospira mobilis]|uniref:PepSY domain-containing protein n=1 Tax=Ectothiorhodospira mobilis TaxID=195064 RepID=UPI00190648C7|nr:PepSY domain-containing protein [Ectothiorhodospira mobilis]
MLLLTTAMFLPAVSHGDDRREHDRILELRASGEILPMAEMLERAGQVVRGEFIEAELEREGGRHVYELKILDADGVLHKLYMDAGTGELLQHRRRNPGD